MSLFDVRAVWLQIFVFSGWYWVPFGEAFCSRIFHFIRCDLHWSHLRCSEGTGFAAKDLPVSDDEIAGLQVQVGRGDGLSNYIPVSVSLPCLMNMMNHFQTCCTFDPSESHGWH